MSSSLLHLKVYVTLINATVLKVKKARKFDDLRNQKNTRRTTKTKQHDICTESSKLQINALFPGRMTSFCQKTPQNKANLCPDWITYLLIVVTRMASRDCLIKSAFHVKYPIPSSKVNDKSNLHLRTTWKWRAEFF